MANVVSSKHAQPCSMSQLLFSMQSGLFRVCPCYEPNLSLLVHPGTITLGNLGPWVLLNPMEPLKVPDLWLSSSQSSTERAGATLGHDPKSSALVEGHSVGQFLLWCSPLPGLVLLCKEFWVGLGQPRSLLAPMSATAAARC